METNEEKNIVSGSEDVAIYKGVKAMPFIIGMETLDRIGTFGTSSNLMVYLTTVFNMKNVVATIFVNIFNGTTYISPLFGGFLSDSYFGRYNTIAFASLSSFMGMSIVMLTAAISKLHPQQCVIKHTGTCAQPTAWQLAFLLTGLLFLVIASGGFRPCLLPFGADQFNPGTDSGKRGISSFFNWYYFTLCFALIISLTLIIYVQSNVSWAIGYAIPACLMLIACILFFSGSKMYVKVKPEGSPLTSVAQVFVAAIKKQKLKLPSSQNSMFSLFEYVPVKSTKSKLSNTSQFRFLDKSAIIATEDRINSDGSAANLWRLCSIQQVEEVKCIIRVIPIWLSSFIYHLATVQQQQTYTILQALQSDRHLGNYGTFKVPAASYGIFTYLSPVIWIPIYDRILVPVLRKYTGKKDGLTLLQRMAIGIIIAILTTLVSALVEQHRKHLVLTRPTLGISRKGGAISSMSAFWLIPQLMLAGLAEAINSIAQIEFYYEQFPDDMRSIGTSIFFCGLAVSSYLNGFLVSIVHHVTSGSSSGDGDWLPEDLNKGKLEYFYYLIACLGCLNFMYFLLCAKWYRYKGGDL